MTVTASSQSTAPRMTKVLPSFFHQSHNT